MLARGCPAPGEGRTGASAWLSSAFKSVHDGCRLALHLIHMRESKAAQPPFPPSEKQSPAWTGGAGPAKEPPTDCSQPARGPLPPAPASTVRRRTSHGSHVLPPEARFFCFLPFVAGTPPVCDCTCPPSLRPTSVRANAAMGMLLTRTRGLNESERCAHTDRAVARGRSVSAALRPHACPQRLARERARRQAARRRRNGKPFWLQPASRCIPSTRKRLRVWLATQSSSARLWHCLLYFCTASLLSRGETSEGLILPVHGRMENAGREISLGPAVVRGGGVTEACAPR